MMEDLSAKFESVRRRYVPKKEFSEEEEIGPLEPLDHK
jgi:hypothetical protein